MPQGTEGAHQTSFDRVDFEELLLEISTLFVNLPDASVDEVIEDTQRKICESLGLDLSSLWQWSDRNGNLMTVTHLYSIPGGPERPVGIDASKSFPWILQKMLTGQTLAFSNDDLPAEAALDLQSRRYFGVESSVDVPLQVGGQPVIGILTFDTLHRVRASMSKSWPKSCRRHTSTGCPGNGSYCSKTSLARVPG